MELCDDKVLGIYICDLAVELIDALTAAAGAVLQLFKLSDQIASSSSRLSASLPLMRIKASLTMFSGTRSLAHSERPDAL